MFIPRSARQPVAVLSLLAAVALLAFVASLALGSRWLGFDAPP